MGELQKIVANNIRVLRIVAKLTQNELAKKAKVSQSTIAQVEKGLKAPSLDTLEKLSKPLKVEVWQIVKAKMQVTVG